MGRFRYLRDPLFLTGCSAYALNRWVIKPHVSWEFMHSHFNDLWLIPCALPPVLWLHRCLKLRAHDDMPLVSEIFWHLVFWSVFCEVIGPRFMPHAIGDSWDVAAYTVGAVVAGLWWRRHSWFRCSFSS